MCVCVFTNYNDKHTAWAFFFLLLYTCFLPSRSYFCYYFLFFSQYVTSFKQQHFCKKKKKTQLVLNSKTYFRLYDF